MKYYRLNKDWEPFDEGDEFIKAEDGGDMYTLKINTGVLAKIPKDLLDEIGDSGGCWRPVAYEYCYSMDDEGFVGRASFCPGIDYDSNRLALGNCFKTKKDAQAMVGWLRARQRLIESGARFINSRDVDADRECFIVYFDVSGEKLTIEDILFNEHSVPQKRLYFDDRQLAQKSIEEHKDNWLTYLGVKEKSDARTDV